MSSDIWATFIGVGVVAVLQNRVGNASDRSLILAGTKLLVDIVKAHNIVVHCCTIHCTMYFM